jgi:hypothetical protein
MTWRRWLPTFLAFPPAGLLVVETVGSIDGPLPAAAGGALAGVIIGAAQWLALRSHGIGRRWIASTGAAMAVGSALAAVVTGAGTELQDLIAAGAITGAAVGAAQARLLGPDARTMAFWTAAGGAAWALGWLPTWSIGVDVERAYIVFGASGALLATVLTGLALRHLAVPKAAAAVPTALA